MFVCPALPQKPDEYAYFWCNRRLCTKSRLGSQTASRCSYRAVYRRRKACLGMRRASVGGIMTVWEMVDPLKKREEGGDVCRKRTRPLPAEYLESSTTVGEPWTRRTTSTPQTSSLTTLIVLGTCMAPKASNNLPARSAPSRTGSPP